MKGIKIISAKEARTNFAELVNEAYYADKKIIVSRSGKPVVMISKVPPEFLNKLSK